jgi:hypothetical protein
MLPGIVTGVPHGQYLQPDGDSYTRLLDHERGGVAVSDPSLGLMGHLWHCRAVGDTVQLRRDDAGWSDLTTMPAPYELAFTFDQNMRPLVATATRSRELSLYWYDPVASSYSVIAVGAGRAPRMSLDDKRHFAGEYSDALLAYIVGDRLVYRMQRDRFLVEHHVATGVPRHARLQQFGMCANLRVQFTLKS